MSNHRFYPHPFCWVSALRLTDSAPRPRPARMPRPCGANCKEGGKKKSKCREGILIETSCVGGQFADREEVLGWRWGGGGAGASGLRPAAGGCRSADGDQTSPRGRARSGGRGRNFCGLGETHSLGAYGRSAGRDWSGWPRRSLLNDNP